MGFNGLTSCNFIFFDMFHWNCSLMMFDVSHSQTHPFWMYKLEVSKKRVVPTNIWIRDDWSLKFRGVLPPRMLDWGPQCMANCLTGKQTNEVLILWKWGWPFPEFQPELETCVV